jgi:hypothetical protein
MTILNLVSRTMESRVSVSPNHGILKPTSELDCFRLHVMKDT